MEKSKLRKVCYLVGGFAAISVVLSNAAFSVVKAERSAKLESETASSVREKLGSVLRQYSKDLRKYYGWYKKIDSALSKGEEPLLRGLKIVAGEPVAIPANLIESIKADSALFERLAREHEVPMLTNPMESVPLDHLDSANPTTRRKALEKIDDQFVKYEQQIKRWEDKRNQAARIASEAEGAFDRVRGLEESLAEINASDAGALLNAATGNKFAYLWADTATILFEAVAERASNASNLLRRYDSAIAEMRRNLKEYELMRDWVRFYILQEALLEGSKPNTGDKKADEALARAAKRFRDARNSQQQGSNVNPPSMSADELDRLLQKAKIQRDEVVQEAHRSWREAQRQDQQEARRQQIQALLGLGNAAANAVTTARSGPQQTTNPSVKNYNLIIVRPQQSDRPVQRPKPTY